MAMMFEQQERESDKAFAAFSLYLNLGPKRSTRVVAEKLAKSDQLIKRWSAKYDWPARVAAHGAYLAEVEREAVAVVARTKAVEWGKRQQELREEEWEVHRECLEAARAALKRFYERGKGATLGDIARMLETASKLGRLATNLATDKTEVTGEDGGAIRVELDAALKKIYGRPLPGEVVDVEEVQKSEVRDQKSVTAGRGLPALPEGGTHD